MCRFTSGLVILLAVAWPSILREVGDEYCAAHHASSFVKVICPDTYRPAAPQRVPPPPVEEVPHELIASLEELSAEADLAWSELLGALD